jgi:hypothetical protein
MFNQNFSIMKNALVLTMLLAVMVIPATAQSCSAPPSIDLKATMGKWHGNYTLNGEIKTLQVEFREADQQLVPYIDMPGHRIRNTRFELKVCGSKELHLKKVNADNTTFEFTGTPKGDKITGRLTIRQGGNRLTEEIFTLTRSAPALTAAN